MTPPLSTVTVTGGPALLYGSKGNATPNIQVINLSTSVTIWIGNTISMQPGVASIPIVPGASTTFDGSVTIYGMTTGGTAQVAIVPGGLSYSPGITTQQLFSVQQPLTIPNNTLAANAVPLSPVLPVSGFASYDFSINAFCNTQTNPGASLTLGIQLTWFDDPAGNVPVYSEVWETWLSSSAGTESPAFGSGPHHGAYFQVSAFQPSINGGLTSAVITSAICYGSPRTLTGSSWRQQPPSSIASPFPLFDTSYNPSSGLSNTLINIQNFTIAANSNLWQPLPLVCGPIYVRAEWANFPLGHNFVFCTASQLAEASIAQGTGSSGVLINASSAVASSADNIEQIVINGRAPTYFTVSAGAGGAPLFSITATAQQGSN